MSAPTKRTIANAVCMGVTPKGEKNGTQESLLSPKSLDEEDVAGTDVVLRVDHDELTHARVDYDGC